MKRMSAGKQNFKDLIDNDYYYVDKTMLIEDILREDVLLYTRPRRFGKTLNMSMLYYFFSINEKENAYLFDGLKITHNEKAMKHMNQYPVIRLTFGGIKNPTLESQIDGIGDVISAFLRRNSNLKNHKNLSNYQHDKLEAFEHNIFERNDLQNSLQIISECMYSIYKRRVIILIDEYDVPLSSSREKYYDDFYDFYSSFLSKTLKYNDYIERGVLTGCFRIVKESIFSGLNNLRVRTLLDYHARDCFGFTQDEVDAILKEAHLEDKREIIRDWYDGYNFCGINIYNPWSLLEYVDILTVMPNQLPQPYWLSTSGNEVIYKYISEMGEDLKKDFRRLLEGEAVSKRIRPDLTYREIDHNQYDSENVFTFLLFGGYLKILEPSKDALGNIIDNTYNMSIPNKEVSKIYKASFNSWFKEKYKNYDIKFIDALLDKDTKEANNILNASLFETLSYYDNNESFYHGYMAKLLSANDYIVESNVESGLGRYDLFVHKLEAHPALLIECKHSKTRENLERDAQKGIEQMIERKYVEGLMTKGYANVVSYCISFYKKECYIKTTS